jgi:protein-S-isoprenylcysteine O-methyltransferase Ste14
MCIVIQVKLKTALCILTLGSIALGTYYGVHSIENNISKTNDIARVECQLLSSVIDDRTGMWYNTWRWNYKNNTYHQTDQTAHVPITYTCCIKVSNPFRIDSCIADKTTIYILYMSTGWSLICILFWCWLWCSRRKLAPATQQSNNSVPELV